MKRTVMLAASLVLVALLAVSVLLVTRQPVTAVSTPSPLLGKVAPTTAGTTLTGSHLNLRAYRGDVVVLTFWASWCTPCRDEAPNLIAFNWAHRHDHVALVGVLFNDEVSAARSFDRYYGTTFPTLIDPHGALAFAYGVTAPPSTFVLNARGRVAATLIGPVSERQLSAVVAKVAS